MPHPSRRHASLPGRAATPGGGAHPEQQRHLVRAASSCSSIRGVSLDYDEASWVVVTDLRLAPGTAPAETTDFGPRRGRKWGANPFLKRSPFQKGSAPIAPGLFRRGFAPTFLEGGSPTSFLEGVPTAPRLCSDIYMIYRARKFIEKQDNH